MMYSSLLNLLPLNKSVYFFKVFMYCWLYSSKSFVVLLFDFATAILMVCSDIYFFSFFPLLLLVPGQPNDLKAEAINSSAVFLNWTEPLEPNGILLKYQVNVFTVLCLLTHSLVHSVQSKQKIARK